MHFQKLEVFNPTVLLLNIDRLKKSHQRRCFQHPDICWGVITVQGGKLEGHNAANLSLQIKSRFPSLWYPDLVEVGRVSTLRVGNGEAMCCDPTTWPVTARDEYNT